MAGTPDEKKQFLVISSRVHDRKDFLRALEERGYTFDQVRSGEEAVKLLKNPTYESVFVDLAQPAFSEGDLLKKLRRTDPQFICLLISETPFEGETYTYLLKPPYTRDLLITLDSAIEKQKLIWENMRMIRELKEANEKLKKLHSEAQEAKDELERTHLKLLHSEKLSSMGQLAASIAHEVNHPITVIIIYARLMLDKLKSLDIPEDVKRDWQRYLEIAYSEMNRCGNMVKNLLEFSRHSKPTVKMVHLETILNRVLTLLEHKANLQNVEIRRWIHDSVEIMANQEQIEQAFMALTVNALQAMSDGGVLTVTLSLDSTPSMPDHVRIQFIDNGSGISEENLKVIFDPFYTSKEDGVGLGLSVVYGIITKHEGEITVESEVGRGTIFTVRLPGRK
ncbi:MAG: ATP-binding protein [bacterium]